jgi:hypothetical protein
VAREERLGVGERHSVGSAASATLDEMIQILAPCGLMLSQKSCRRIP